MDRVGSPRTNEPRESGGTAMSRNPISPFPPAPTASPPSHEEQQDEAEAAALAISDRRTLYLVNIFIGSAARFLNSFAAICEDKLADVHRRILRLDSTLRLLEAKLSGTSKSGDVEAEEDGESQQEQHLRSSSSSSPPPPPGYPSGQIGTTAIGSRTS